jgi:predicted enzyme related to lactoylglutathione lyase
VERVIGIGGVFSRARDPEALRAWYERTSGSRSRSGAGTSSYAVPGDCHRLVDLRGESEYWPAQQQAMVNYRVRDLDAILAQLRAAGVEVDERVEEQEFGRFGWAVDPDGNRFELWQPATPS